MASYRILLFGPQATLADAREIKINIEADSITAADLMSKIGEQIPAIKPSLATTRLAINHEFVSADDTVDTSSEIALIGMI